MGASVVGAGAGTGTSTGTGTGAGAYKGELLLEVESHAGRRARGSFGGSGSAELSSGEGGACASCRILSLLSLRQPGLYCEVKRGVYKIATCV